MSKWPPTRIYGGLYLLIGDDDRTLFCVRSYRESGDVVVRQANGNRRHITGTYWALDRLRNNPSGLIDRDDEGRIVGYSAGLGFSSPELQRLGYFGPAPEWETCASLLPTKTAAVDIAASLLE